jgi:hypothetical protein
MYTHLMKRLQIYIEEELDDALRVQAAREGTSKAALIRQFVADRLGKYSAAADPLDSLVGRYDEEAGPIDELVYDR